MCTRNARRIYTYIVDITTEIVRWLTEPLAYLDKMGMQVSVR
jgi:hypothetical protein